MPYKSGKARVEARDGCDLAERIIDWGDTATDFPRESSLAELFAAQVARHSDAMAVRFGSESLSYRELDQRAKQLAHHLRRRGVHTETLVGMFFERSVDMLVAMLGILKAGGAYVPLDLSYPAERLSFMLDDAKIGLLLTQSSLLNRLPDINSEIVCLDRVDFEAEPITEPTSTATGANLAYVIYTSGSTGLPKGVGVVQRAVSRLVLGTDYLNLGPSDHVGQASNSSFDAATFEVWGALLNGARLVGISQQVLLEPKALAATLRQEDISTLFLTTALFNQIAREIPSAFETLRTVLFGGEAVDPRWVRQVLAAGPPERLLHVYGPTENTTFSTWHPVREVAEDAVTIAIGGPLANTTGYVLDQRLRSAPIAGVGELNLGGDGLARGYLGRPGLTAERWVPSPFGSGERLYRTGDLVRMRHEGTIEFSGRRDHQVKIRGFRVELGEIEAILNDHPEVQDSIVVVRDDSSASDWARGGNLQQRQDTRADAPAGDRRQLAAYVCPHDETEINIGGLRTHLAERLPSYMVPRSFVVLTKIPLTPNGKVDRAALPAPHSRDRRSAPVTAPQTPTEKVLAEIWSDLLGIDCVGSEDNFLDLGGHSLLAMQAVSRIRQELDVTLSLRVFFDVPNLSALASSLLANADAVAVASPTLQPLSRDEHLLLSFDQQRLWLLDRLQPGSPLYNVPLAVRMEGTLDIEVLAECLNQIVERHEVLRTRFPAVAGQPVQVVSESARLQLGVSDLTKLPGDQRAAELARLKRLEARSPFDLSQGPVIRGHLVRVSECDHTLILNLHHIVSDAWSLKILLDELEALYPALAAGSRSPLAPLPIQFVDYANWQRRWLSGEVYATELKYWRRQLAGAPGVLDLPTDRPRPPVQTFAGEVESFHWTMEHLSALRQLSRQWDGTLFMTLLATLQVVLSRYVGQQDLCVGTPIANRGLAETEGLIGFFVNTLVIRTDLSKRPSFGELLGRVRESALQAYAHQNLPFEKLVEELQPERSLSHAPLVQVFCALQSVALDERRLPDLRIRHEMLRTGTAKFDLMVGLSETDQGLEGFFEYATDLFDATTIQRLGRHWQALTERVIEDPNQEIANIDFLTASERVQILEIWNDNTSAFPRNATITSLFKAQAERTPLAIAVTAGVTDLTYHELDQQTDQLARYLSTHGIGGESLVAVFTERTPELVVALLGILKAGAGYVPLDPDYPSERLSFMLNDGAIDGVLTQAHLLDRIPDSRATLICLDRDGARIAAASAAVPPVVAAPEALAYVIYTSGSTGIPKGVAIAHSSVVAMLSWARSEFTARDLEGVLASTSVCFDLSVFEIFLPLSTGGRVILVENLLHLPDLPARSHVTLINTVPSALTELLRRDGAPRSLRIVNVAGEPLERKLVDQAYALPSVEAVYNLYGPSEGTTYSTYARLPQRSGEAPSIGRGVDNTLVYILDGDLNPMPAGFPGELCIGGAGVVRGYLERPALTAQRFLPDPFSKPGTRLYRTGDQARFRDDGTLDFLGRLDYQIKLRGFRIELGEIEAVLNAHSNVEESVVLVREVGGQKSLVACVSSRSEPPPKIAELRSFLANQLPHYMVPGGFLVLATMPLTPNGKVDRKALALEAGQASLMGDDPSPHKVTPRTSTEKVVAGMWEELLSVDSPGLGDNFFHCGGHSLLANQLLARIAQAFNTELPMRVVFEAPTIESLAARIDAALSSARSSAPRMVAVERGDKPLPLSFAQHRMWFLTRIESRSRYNVPFAMRLSGALEIAVLQSSLNEIIRRHESLRTTFPALEGQPAQEICKAFELNLGVVDLSVLDPAVGDGLALELAKRDSMQPFDLAQGPLIRGCLLRLATCEHVLLLSLHHIVSDAWSVGVLLRELAVLYEALRQGRPSPLKPLPIQYADFALWQRDWFQGPVRDQQLAYWRRTLAGAPPMLELPTDRPRPRMSTERGAQVDFDFRPGLMDGLRKLSQDRDSTLFMTILASFQALLYHYAGQDDVSVGAPTANRAQVEVEGLIGFFVNMLVMRTELSGDPTFHELLARVREVALGALAHKDMPFEQVVEALQPDRSQSHTPLFQVALDVRDETFDLPELAGLKTRLFRADPGVAKFDLFLAIGVTEKSFAEVNTDLFDVVTIRRLVGHLEVLLASIVDAPTTRLCDLDLLASGQRQQLLYEWNDTRSVYPDDVTIPTLFKAVVGHHAMATAVVFDADRLSYSDLDRKSSQLGWYLRSRGVGPDSAVGLFVRRSTATVMASLGILKAGGAYLPLDSDYPAARISLMLEDANVEVLLTEDELIDRLPAFDGEVFCLDRDLASLASQPVTDLPEVARPDNLAYIIYTSGSTGRPKGVAVSHRAVVRLVRNTNYVHFGPDDRLGQVANTSFDAATFELWGALLNGGRVVVIPQDVLLSSKALAQRLRDEGISAMFLTSALFNQVVSEVPDAFATVKNLLVGGEAVDPRWARKALKEGPPTRLLNGYGPTESTTFAVWHPIQSVPRQAATVPIGRPLSNSTAYVLDRSLRVSPCGVLGELYLGGDGLARCYHNRPGLTAERFVPSSHGSAGCRLYRTGDVVQRQPTGEIVYLRRRDHQVKIRGFRIELGEIEAVLNEHSEIQDSVVLVTDDHPAGDPAGGGSLQKRLVAFVVTASGVAPAREELRAFLQRKLPGYMLPATVVGLTTLPLTENGKLDRATLSTKLLPASGIAAAEFDGEAPRRLPETPTQQSVVAAVSEVLGIDNVDLQDSFFGLGGHSLLAPRVTSLLQKTLGAEVELRMLFEAEDLRAFATQIDQLLTEGDDDLARLLDEIEDLSLEDLEQQLDEADDTLTTARA